MIAESLVVRGVVVEIPELVRIGGGEFLMGKDGSRKDEAPRHRVVIGPFRAGVRPVTNAQYTAYAAASGAAAPPFLGEARFAAPGQPVAGIGWHDAVAYCEWLRAQTGVRFRLPTEAEREYAARGRLESGDWPWTGALHPLSELIERTNQPHVPFPECANGYGLLCMAENVHEWCSDWYSADYYAVSPVEDPRGPERGERRVSRGGSWRHAQKVTRVNARSSLDPSFRYNDFGFRVCADA